MEAISDGVKIKNMTWHKVNPDFYIGNDVIELARQLLGYKLVSCFNNELTSGIITETEAYAGVTDRASHAFGGRRTQRTETMYQKGGFAYIYLCYGIHSLFNVVTNQIGIPHAVLIRGIFPLEGISAMQERIRRKPDIIKDGSGPGKVARLLGMDYNYNGIDLTVSNQLWIEKSDFVFDDSKVRTTKRIGVDYAMEDANLPYRFVIDHRDAAVEIKKAGLE
jgi:DNA-3-methyladenine glycosylase